MKKIRCILALICICASSSAFAYKVRCNEDQKECEVDTKRLVMGDRVGIFDSDGLIVAIGTVKKLKGRLRIVQINKKFGTIQDDHELVLIRDEEAQNPRQFFKFFKPAPTRAFAFTLGLTNMGIGEGFTAMDAQFYVQWKFRENTYVVGRGMFITGTGKTSKTDLKITQESLSVTVIGAAGGLAYVLFPQKAINLRVEGAFGFGQVNANISGGADVNDFTDGRIKPGMDAVVRIEGAAIYHWDDWQLIAAADFLRLHNSNNFGLAFGSLFTF